MTPETRNWIECAHYDLQVGRDMLSAGRYIYVVFMCHLALEKTLKAAVSEHTGSAPPKTHDLIRLVKLSGLSIEQKLLEFLGIINNASIPTRYPEDLNRALAEFPRLVVADYLKRTEEGVEWLNRSLGWPGS